MKSKTQGVGSAKYSAIFESGSQYLSLTQGLSPVAPVVNIFVVIMRFDAFLFLRFLLLIIVFSDTFKLYTKGPEDSFVIDMTSQIVSGDSSATELRFSTGTEALTDIEDLFDPNNPFLIVTSAEDATMPDSCLNNNGGYSTCDQNNDRVYFDPSKSLSCLYFRVSKYV